MAQQKTNLREARQQLLRAIQAQDSAKIQHLLQAHEGLANAQNAHHNVPLSEAIQTGSLKIVQLLIDHGADPSHRNHGGHSLLDGATFAGQVEAARLLIAYGAQPTVHHAAAIGDLELLKRKLAEDPTRLGATKAGGRWKMTPLHAAVQAGNVEATRFLLDAGADVDALNHNEHTPLDLVPDSPNAEARVPVALVLLAAGADPNTAAGFHGGMVLHRAVMNGDAALSRALLEQGADPNRQDWSGKTPLHYAVAKNRKLVDLLLEFSPDLTLTNNEGETPLDYARRLKKKAVTALLEAPS